MSLALYNGDCLEIMLAIPKQSVDLILCDLPYGITSNKWDSIIPLEQLWKEYKRVTKPQAAIVLNAVQPFASQLIMSNPSDFRYEWIWRKTKATGFLNVNTRPMREHEQLLVFYRKQGTYNPQMTQGKPYYLPAGGEKGGDNYRPGIMQYETVNAGTRYPVTILTFPSCFTNQHPTQKPIDLMAYMIQTYSNQGDTVLDNCMGSGTTGVAAMQYERAFIGIERDPDYFQIAKERITTAQKKVEIRNQLFEYCKPTECAYKQYGQIFDSEI